MRRIAVAGPTTGEAVRTVNLLPAAALAGSAAVAFLLWRRRYERSRLRGDNFSWSSGVCSDPGGLFEFDSAVAGGYIPVPSD